MHIKETDGEDRGRTCDGAWCHRAAGGGTGRAGDKTQRQTDMRDGDGPRTWWLRDAAVPASEHPRQAAGAPPRSSGGGRLRQRGARTLVLEPEGRVAKLMEGAVGPGREPNGVNQQGYWVLAIGNGASGS
ncbi:hypothetical protein AcV7_005613 [Taiwanofungus camphoratus]|nr:hypothetical protein AcV7_005613 [Antrodia cinnamomea]